MGWDNYKTVEGLCIPLYGLEPDAVPGHEGDASDILQATARGVLAGVKLECEGLVQPDQRQDRLLDGEPAESTAAAELAQQHTGLGLRKLCKQGKDAGANTQCPSPAG